MKALLAFIGILVLGSVQAKTVFNLNDLVLSEVEDVEQSVDQDSTKDETKQADDTDGFLEKSLDPPGYGPPGHGGPRPIQEWEKHPCDRRREWAGACDHICHKGSGNEYTCSCRKGYRLGIDEKQCIQLKCPEVGVEYSRWDLGIVNPNAAITDTSSAKSWEDCNALCKTNTDCRAWTWYTSESNMYRSKCHLKGEGYQKGRSYGKGAVSGTMDACTTDASRKIYDCDVNNGGCDDTCQNTPGGGHTCSCRDGYRLGADEHECKDINECDEGNDCDDETTTCQNSQGGYECQCAHPGFRRINENKCGGRNEDQCAINNGGCQHKCVKEIGGSGEWIFHCECNTGFNLAPDHKTCIDLLNRRFRENCRTRASEAECSSGRSYPFSDYKFAGAGTWSTSPAGCYVYEYSSSPYYNKVYYNRGGTTGSGCTFERACLCKTY